MHPTKPLFPLAALLSCLPATGQEDGRKPAPRTIHFEVQASADGFAAILLAPDDRLMQLGGKVVLADGNLVLLPKQEQGKFAYDMEIPVEVTFDLYWQAVTWDSAKGLQIKAPQKIELDSAAYSPVVNRIPAPGGPMEPQVQVVHETGSDAFAEGDEINRSAAEPAGRFTITLEKDDYGNRRLAVGFDGPNDGYGLTISRVGNAPGGAFDVYLYRKLPGESEGLLDIVEHHAVKVELPDGTERVRLLLADGTAKKPEGDVLWRVLTSIRL